MLLLKALLIIVVAVPLLLFVLGQAGAFSGKPPQGLGVTGGKLKRPAFAPNSVSSQAALWPDHPQRAYAEVAPLPLVGGGDGPGTIARLRTLVEALPGAKVVEQRNDYLAVQFTTRLMKFTDDAEFWFDPVAKVIQVRSASRVGRKDFGVNRARIEALRAALAVR